MAETILVIKRIQGKIATNTLKSPTIDNAAIVIADYASDPKVAKYQTEELLI